MSKESKEPKNYTDYGYAGDEEIVISVQEFTELQKAIQKAVQNGLIVDRPQAVKWVDRKTRKDAKFSMKAAQEGTIISEMDVEATRSDENVNVRFDNNLFPEIFDAQGLLMGVHFRNVENGVAKHKDDLRKAFEERQVKGQMKIEDEEVVGAEEVEAPQRPQPQMDVVRDETIADDEQVEDKQ